MDLKEFLKNKIVEDKYFLNNNIDNKSSRQSLWHGIKIEHAKTALENMKLDAHTTQRYWPNGQRLKEDHQDYENSFWIYGWSTTRKKEYAMNWGSVVFEFDHEKIQQQFEVKPFSWNFLFKHNKTIKKHEFEEFIIASYFEKSIPQLKKEDVQRDIIGSKLEDEIYEEKDPIKKEELRTQLNKLYDEPNWFKVFNTPKGKSLDLNSCLKGVYIDKFLVDHDFKDVEFIVNHPKFKGMFISDIDKPKNKTKLKV